MDGMNQETHVHKAFEVHMLNVIGRAKAASIASAFDALLEQISPLVGDPRLLALITTKLEEACFFAKKSMAQEKDNQER